MSKPSKLSQFIFLSRWLQAPLYVGLILVMAVYVYQFAIGLYHLVLHAADFGETYVMLQALDLIDMVMIANLLIMVVIGGYETFVTHLHLDGNPEKPEWLDEVNAGSMKVKLAIALISISSIHLLRTFMDPSQNPVTVKWQVIIHLTLVVSAIALAYTNTLMESLSSKSHGGSK